MYNLGQKIMLLRKKENMTQDELAEKLNISKQSILNYETEKRLIPIDVLSNIAKLFNFPIENFFSNTFDDNEILKNSSKIKKIPIISKVSAGTGVFGIEDVLDWLEMPTSLCKNCDFATFIDGDSMEPKVYDNDLILVQKTTFLDNGSIGIFKIGEDVFCKKFYQNPITKAIVLKSINKSYNSISITSEDEFYILGKVVCKIDYNF
ncbi:phage repressor protein [Fusobacterium ulcerans]|uniref:LexA repressor n=1 Tax=Fusobacterium ulcerans TaxID=861 RepID=A0AAX2JCN4_9FUSO|nr:XRE family transcriptional regulator [Fusobacterium ulcerans]AVQ26917.1 phage repressor protein [Fusobacterium ulcerans]EFS24954.1 hypothetical protein FUAG_00469 [Fusobacterium ulcerans ATCC 49185]SQJ09290.1 LexA repressor [Fusobacterium ulcerans]